MTAPFALGGGVAVDQDMNSCVDIDDCSDFSETAPLPVGVEQMTRRLRIKLHEAMAEAVNSELVQYQSSLMCYLSTALEQPAMLSDSRENYEPGVSPAMDYLPMLQHNMSVAQTIGNVYGNAVSAEDFSADMGNFMMPIGSQVAPLNSVKVDESDDQILDVIGAIYGLISKFTQHEVEKLAAKLEKS